MEGFGGRLHFLKGVNFYMSAMFQKMAIYPGVYGQQHKGYQKRRCEVFGVMGVNLGGVKRGKGNECDQNAVFMHEILKEPSQTY